MRIPLNFIRTHREDINTIGYMITVVVAVGGLLMLINQLQLQTEAINLQTEVVNTQNQQLKLQLDALEAQNEQIKFQREALQAQLNLNKPILTQNMHCPALWPNTVNHAEYTIYNIGRSSGRYRIQFKAENITLRALNFSCVSFSTLCTTEPDYAISANDKDTYMLDLKIDDNAENPEFTIKLQCMSEDCFEEPAKSWTCRYAYNSRSRVYEPVG